MPYFTISSGLRGAYIDDSPYVIQVKTRRELKEAIAYEASIWRDGGYIGANKKAIASIAAAQWKDKKNYLPYALPLAPAHSPRNYSFAVFVSPASRDDFLEYQKSAE
jgi:hypothetical protein